jgi:TonB family protein
MTTDNGDARLPATLTASMVLHAAALAGWLYFSGLPKPQQGRILTNVELMVASRPAPVASSPSSVAPPNTWNFLKLALPSVPKPLEIETAKTEPKPMLEPEKRLREETRRAPPKLDSLVDRDPGRRTPRPSLEDPTLGATKAAPRPRLAEAPRLEEVGDRRASKDALAMSALVEAGHARAAPQSLSALAPEPSRPARALPAAQTLTEAPVAGAARAKPSGLADLLPAEAAYGSRPGPRLAGTPMDVPAPEKRRAEALTEKKKAATIEGPLHGRKVLHAEVPRFPAWAQAQGVLEATVRIRFNVDAGGRVLEEVQLVQTSGYGELDRLAMDSLKAWLFEPKPEGFGEQWGIITFRFVME